MDIRDQVISKYMEFSQYLESIDVNAWKGQFSRKELQEFESSIRKIKIRSLPYDISKLTDEMKKEEYPQLLGVHHFPLINKIEFLSEEQKIKLDEHLVKHQVGNYVNDLWGIVKDQKLQDLLFEWLLDKGVLEKKYAVMCPGCHDGIVSKLVDEEEKNHTQKLFDQYKEDGNWDLHEQIVTEFICMGCDQEFELDEISKLSWKLFHEMKMKRDNSLDNV